MLVVAAVAFAFYAPSLRFGFFNDDPTGHFRWMEGRSVWSLLTDAAGHKAGTLFTDDALQRIFECAKGIPRRINQVCTTALMAGLIDQKSVLDESTIRKAIADIDHD